MLTIQDITERISGDLEISRKQAKSVANFFLSKIESALLRGEEVRLRDIGTLKVVERPARKGRNPRTGEEIEIPAKTTV